MNLAFPEPDAFFLAWIAIAPFLVILDGAGPKRGSALGLAFGFGFFGILISWISVVGWAAWFLSVLLEASFFGLFGLIWGSSSKRAGSVARVFVPASLWVAIEFLRTLVPFHGFTWGQLALSQHNFPYLLKTAGLAGGWTIAFLLVATNALLGEGVAHLRAGRRRNALVAAGGLLALALLPAFVPTATAGGAPLKVAIVQGNVPDMDPSVEKDLSILRSHSDLTKGLAGEGADLIVWPESSVGIDPIRNQEIGDEVDEASRVVDAPMIVGGNESVDESHYRVMAYEVEPGKGIVDRYQKTHLVPFGEYVPGRKLLSWIPMLDQIPDDAVAGTERTLFDIGDDRVIAPVLSFEGDFGPLVRQRIADGGRLLVVATNTSTWRRTWVSAQHAAFSQVRAAENGVWVIHAALSGISEFIGPDGRVTGRAPLYEATTLLQDVRFADHETLYTRMGDWLPIAGGVVVLLWALFARRRDRGGDSVVGWQ